MRSLKEQSKQSVVQVVDPQVYLRSVKKHLSEKQGLPAEHQRLTFTVAAAVDTAATTPPLPGSAESLLSGLDTWQALVYHNKKCVGRFIKPRLYSVSQFGDTREEQFADCPVQQLSIIYDCFKAACTDGPAKVSVPIVTADAFEQYRFTVVGRCEECNFVLPVTYQFSGQQVAYNLQKSLYTTKHQQSQAAAAGTVSALSPLITNSDLALNFGTGLELFSAVFEPEADSAWLKSSEDQAVAANGFTARGMLNTAPKGVRSNGRARTQSSSSIAGSSEDAVGSAQRRAPHQQPPAADFATDDALDLQSTINGAASTSLESDGDFLHPPMTRRSHRTSHLPSGSYTNGYAPSINQAYPQAQGGVPPELANAGYPGGHTRLTSSLQSLDLANNDWQIQRSGQGQHPPGQRWSRGGRPTGHDAGPATQPSSARVSPERMRDGHSESDAHPPVTSANLSYRPHKVSPGMRHAAYPAPASLSALYSEQGARPGASTLRQFDNRHGSGSMKCATEAAMLGSSGQMTGSFQEPRRMLADWQRPAPLQSRDMAAATDVERLLQQLTPVLSENDLNAGQLTLGDLWQWYLEPSLYGTEVLTMGGSRGPSVSYYVPYLSAMQLLLPLDNNAASQPPSAAAIHSAQMHQQQQQQPVSDSMQESADAQSVSHAEKHQRLAVPEQAAGQQAGHHQQPARASGSPRSSRVYQVEADWQPWPRQVQPLFELFDTELPFNRVPMHDKVQELAAGRLACGLPGSLLNSQPLAELHPASWFSVVWYPAYRIPDAPLNGRFLTFHHVTPQPRPSSSQQGIVTDASRNVRAPVQQAESPQREARRFRDVAGWVFPDERARSDPSTGATTSTVGTNTGVTALQQLRFLRELRARELRASGEESARVEPCPRNTDAYVSRDVASFAEASPTAECAMDCSEEQDLRRPAPCSYLQPGQQYQGTQRVSQASATASEDWGVQVCIEEVNLETGYVCGSMRAENVPKAKSPVVTFWEGDIIDNVNHSFITCKWGADKKIDVKHWPRFDGFEPLRKRVQNSGGRCGGLSTHTHIFMRWKERNFVNVGEDCGLTIAGFYYICISRQTGSIEGFYHDPHSSPFQKLQLRPLQAEWRQGYVSSQFEYR
ncbi:hypothetical protein WJX82_000107 [Trebouxia sp. C0006]